MIALLSKGCPLFSRELLAPRRLASLVFGLGLLIAGSVFLPSMDWNVPLCFVMGIPAYVLAPWTFRQFWYLRWKWMPCALFAFWVSVDGTYSLYWWLLRGADFLPQFRLANLEYCTPIFALAGFIWNLDFSHVKGLGWLCVNRDASVRRGPSVMRNLGWVALAVLICEAFCFHCHVALDYYPILGTVIHCIELLGLIFAIALGLMFPSSVQNPQSGVARWFAVLVGGVLGGIMLLWTALGSSLGIFCLIVMPRVPTEKLIEIAQRELVATDTEKLMEEVKTGEADYFKSEKCPELWSLRRRLKDSYRYFDATAGYEYDKPPQWYVIRFGNHSRYGYIKIQLNEDAQLEEEQNVVTNLQKSIWFTL